MSDETDDKSPDDTATVEMPPMVTGFQLQELLTYMEAAYEVRMNTAALMGMDPALLALMASDPAHDPNALPDKFLWKR